MAIEDNLDQLYALYATNTILCMRIWAYIAMIGAKTEAISVEAFIARHRKMSLESADLWTINHQNPEKLREIIKQQLNQAWDGMILGAPPGSRPQ
jgi:hypothetical protein